MIDKNSKARCARGAESSCRLLLKIRNTTYKQEYRKHFSLSHYSLVHFCEANHTFVVNEKELKGNIYECC